jgi:hypothetical protein
MKQETLEPIVYNIGDNIRIINPTENQPKLFTTHKVDNNFGVVYYYQLDGKEESIGFSYIKKEETKQETLEEAAEKYLLSSVERNQYGDELSFIDGAKWQQERSYSEQEVLEHLNHLIMMPSSELDLYTDDEEMVTMKWFERFKKK